jgi:hypothetical protein
VFVGAFSGGFDFAALEAAHPEDALPTNCIPYGVGRANLLGRSVTVEGCRVKIIGKPQRWVSTQCKRHSSPKKFGTSKCFQHVCDRDSDFTEILEMRELVVTDVPTSQSFSVSVKEASIRELFPELTMHRLSLLFSNDQVDAYFAAAMDGLEIICDVFVYKNFNKVTYTLKNCRRA